MSEKKFNIAWRDSDDPRQFHDPYSNAQVIEVNGHIIPSADTLRQWHSESRALPRGVTVDAFGSVFINGNLVDGTYTDPEEDEVT